jgi:hypothetical protein
VKVIIYSSRHVSNGEIQISVSLTGESNHSSCRHVSKGEIQTSVSLIGESNYFQ